MKSLAVVLLLGSWSLSTADPIISKVSYNGAIAGENTYESKPDGTFTSVTTLRVGTIDISSDLYGRTRNGKIVELNVKEAQGEAKAELTYAGGIANASANGKPALQNHKLDWDGSALFHPYHPMVVGDFYTLAKTNRNKPIAFLMLQGLLVVKQEVSLKGDVIDTDSGVLAIERLGIDISGIHLETAFYKGDSIGLEVKSQRYSIARVGFEKAFLDPVLKYPELSQPTEKVRALTGLKLEIPNGPTLVADVKLPAGDGPFPVILVRTPYGRAASLTDADFWASRGYAFVAQDVRGKGDSTGSFDPLNTEVQDGKDTLDWVVKQPWCNGKVGMIGGSYLGYVQWAAAVTHHPALKCIIPQVSPPDPMHNIPYDHGVFTLFQNLWWARLVDGQNADLSQRLEDFKNPLGFLATPATSVDDQALGRNIPFFDQWLERDSIEKWTGAFRLSQIGTVKIPILHISGTWDGDGIGTKLHWQELRRNGGNQRLIFGPWTHAFNSSSAVGGLDFGSGAILELQSLYLRFFDTHLKGRAVKLDEQPRVRFFVTGLNMWVTDDDWPIKRSRSVTYFLTKDTLSLAQPKKSSVGQIHNDPNATQFKGSMTDLGGDSFTEKLKPAGKDEARFLTPAFASDTIISGPVQLNLTTSSTVVDGKLSVMVYDHAPDGRSTVIAMPGRKRFGFNGRTNMPVAPNKPFNLIIEPWEFAHQFKKGHRLMIRVVTDLFPFEARIAGTGETELTAKEFLKSVISLHYGGSSPSTLTVHTFAP